MTHDFEFQQSFSSNDVVPWCSCGWSGRPASSFEQAQDAWSDHCDDVFEARSAAVAKQMGWAD